MAKKEKADIEIKVQIEKLWAQYGRLGAKREPLAVALQIKVQQMRQIQEQIATLTKTLEKK